MKDRIIVLFLFLAMSASAHAGSDEKKGHPRGYKMPKLREKAVLTYAPEVPAPIKRTKPAIVEVHLNSSVEKTEIKPGVFYEYWTFNGQVPGPFIRVHV